MRSSRLGRENGASAAVRSAVGVVVAVRPARRAAAPLGADEGGGKGGVLRRAHIVRRRLEKRHVGDRRQQAGESPLPAQRDKAVWIGI